MLETLLVLVVGGMLLLAAAGFLFGTISLRRQIEETPQLKQHAASVARLLEGLIASAEPQQGAAEAGSVEGGMISPIHWQALPDVVFGSEQALYLRARPGLPLFVGQEGQAQGTVSCYLLFERDKGLLLFWQTERMRRDDERNWERTVLSPLVSAVRLLYYDAERERWEQSEGLGQLFSTPDRLPQVMQITFREPGAEREISAEVLLPPEATQLLGL